MRNGIKRAVLAVVLAAFVEILARKPSAQEADFWTQWMNETKENSDELRRILMSRPEFVDLHGFHAPRDLQDFRLELWLGLIESAFIIELDDGLKFPNVKTLYEKAKVSMLDENSRRAIFPQ